MLNRDTAILQLMHAKRIGTKKLFGLLEKLRRERTELVDFVQFDRQLLLYRYGLDEQSVESLQQNQEECEELSDVLYEHGIRVLAIGDKDFPVRLIHGLSNSAPPVLFAKGNINLLTSLGVGFCGSRKPSERGLIIAADCARQLAEQHVNVISGYAHGIDSATHRSATAAGGTTTIVLATGILNFSMKRSMDDLLDERNSVIISEFPPKTGWFAHNAMKRNKTICALSQAIVIIESGETGGTFDAGKTALELGRPLYVVDYSEKVESARGNRFFLDRGASPLRPAKDGHSNLRSLLRAVESDAEGSQQGSLF